MLAFQRRWAADDAFIDYRVVRNFLEGHGPVFNPGERIEAFSNPLWVMLLSAAGALGLRIEHAATALGLLLATLAMVLAALGARRLAVSRPEDSRSPPSRAWLPLGLIILAALPPMWDFASSGLETGLGFAWLAGTFYLLAAHGPRLPAAVMLGLGPLVRPDFGLYSIAFAIAWLRHPDRRGRAPALAAGVLGAGALPCGYQLFRMGYYAALVPAPALAKDAGHADILRGLRYAADFALPYLLPLPLVAAALAAAPRFRHPLARTIALAAFWHAGYVVWVGGDFMHARLLLPALFALLLPIAVLPVSELTRPRGLRAAAVVCAWALGCALFLRVPYAGDAARYRVADERGWYVRRTRVANPTTIEDFAAFHPAAEGARLGQRAQAIPAGRGVLLLDRPDARDGEPLRPAEVRELPLAPDIPGDPAIVVARGSIGVFAYAAGARVRVVDRHGLADLLAARLPADAGHPPGHRKWLTEAWIVARYTLPSERDDGAVRAAREALAAADTATRLRAIEAPLTPRRFAANLALATTGRLR